MEPVRYPATGSAGSGPATVPGSPSSCHLRVCYRMDARLPEGSVEPRAPGSGPKDGWIPVTPLTPYPHASLAGRPMVEIRSLRRLPAAVAIAAVLLPLAMLAGPGTGAPADVERFTVEVSPLDLVWHETPEGVRASLPGAVAPGVPGAPDLPQLPLGVDPPAGMRLASVEASVVRWEPLEPPAAVGRVVLEGVSADPAPAEPPARVGLGGYARGRRVDAIVLSPVQPAPGGGWRLAALIELTVRFLPDPGGPDARPLRPERPRPGVLSASTKDPATASEPFSPRFRPSLDGSPVELVIVTGESLVPEFERLAQWRTRSGIPSVVRTMDWVNANYEGSDTAERLRMFLRDAVNLWGATGVVLGGDSQIVPIRYGRTTFFFGEDIPTDLYFQCLDGSWNANGNDRFGEGTLVTVPTMLSDQADLLPDVYLGRVPVTTVDEARAWIDKILAYETEPPVDGAYPLSALLLAEVLFPQDWTPGSTIFFDGAELAESTAVLIGEGFEITKLYENYVPFTGALPETLPAVVNELNAGHGIVHHVGHGFHDNMAMGLGGGSITTPIVDQLVNGNRTFFLYSINCTSSAVDFDAIGEHFISNPNGGSVASVGSTRFDFPGTSESYDQEFYRLVFRDGVERLGEAAARAKVPYTGLAGSDNAHRWTQFTLIYFGDPMMRLWTAPPTPLEAEYIDDVSGLESEVSITVTDGGVPFPGAQVTLYKSDEFYASGPTDASGTVVLTIRTLPHGVPETASVTATAPNKIPFRGTLTIGPVSAPWAEPRLLATMVDDSPPGGNGNDRLEAGETALVGWRIQTDLGELTGVEITPTFDSTGLSVVEEVATFTSLAPGDSALHIVRMSLAPDAPDLTVARVILEVAADQGSWSVPDLLYLSAPRLEIYELVVEEITGDGDGVVEPGEEAAITPRLVNLGAGAAPPLTGVLAVASGDATVTRSIAEYPPIPAGGMGPGEGFEPFLVEVGDSPPTLSLAVAGGSVTALAGTLDLEPPGVPTLPVSFGGASSIRLSWTAPADTDLLRYVVYRSDSVDGPYERISGALENANAVYVDEPLPPLAPKFYRLAAQDSSGNLSPVSIPVRGTTTLPLEKNFPLRSGIGTPTSALVADIDGDGRLDVFTGGEHIYAFHGDGSELIDGDTDARTLGVWSDIETERGWWAAPSAGDLDGDGRLEVVAISFVEGLLAVWDGNGTLLPGWPRNTGPPAGTIALGSPALGDLDGDGTLEILVHASRAVYAFDRFGDEVLDGDGDPATDGVFFYTGSSASYATVAPFDFDGDGRVEVAVATRDSLFYLLDDDATVMPGFPVEFGGDLVSSPAIADLDGDSRYEMIFATGADSVEVLRDDGTRFPGWPQSALMNQDFFSSPAVADLDNDGDLEIAIVSGNTTVHVWHHDGVPVGGFPVRFYDDLGSSMAARGSPAAGNLDDDEDLEIVFGNQDGLVFALNLDGSLADGFPLRVGGGVEGGVLLYDVDADGWNELCVAGLDREVYLYQTSGEVLENPGWPMFHHDARRTGAVDVPVREGVVPALTLGVLQTAQLPDRASLYAVSTRRLVETPGFLVDGEPAAAEPVDDADRVYRVAVSLDPGTHTFEVTAVGPEATTAEADRTFDVLAPAAPGWRASAIFGVELGVDDPSSWPSRVVVAGAAPGESLPGWIPPGDGRRRFVGPTGHALDPGASVRFAVDEAWTGAAVSRWDGESWIDVPVSGFETGWVTARPRALGWFRLRAAAPPVAGGLSGVRAYPNPFRGASRIAFRLSANTRVRVEVFDVRGARVAVVADRAFAAGDHVVTWTGRDAAGTPAPPGVFFVRVAVPGGETRVQKVVRVSGGEE